MILHEVKPLPVTGERVGKIASSYQYVHAGTSVFDLLEEIREPYKHAIAVVDPGGTICGSIFPKDLVKLLGKPFGRDLLSRQHVEDIMRETVTFRYDAYIQEVRDRIAGDLEKGEENHYILVDKAGHFCAHVCSQDILLQAFNDHRREIETAMAIQNRLVPPCRTIQKDTLSIICSAVMAQGIGGDYYHVTEFSPGVWFFCLCDISGKGISAAIITAVLAGFMHNADFSLPFSTLIGELNRIILDTFKLEKYLTGFFARFTEETGELEYCDMGHALFYALEDSRLFQISPSADNVPVGLVEKPAPESRTLRLAPGTLLIIMSDGFTEQENRKKISFPIQNLGSLLHSCLGRGGSLVSGKVRIFEEFYRFKQDMPQHDDISLLLFHYGEEIHG